MDQYTISRDQSAVIDRPVLIFGEDDMLCAPAIRTIEDAGLRLGGRVPVGAARERLALQGTAAALWIELPHELDDEGSALLAQVDQDVSEGRYAAIVSTTPELIDPIVAKIKDPRIEIIVNADEAQRAAALAVGLASLEGTRRVADVASDKGAERLRQLSEEVNRIAATLARLSTGPSPTAAPTSSPALEEAPHVAADTVRSVIRARRLRSRYFPEELFADPAWDMLLDLLQAEIAQLRVPVSSLCIAAAVPATTALRWLKTMVQEGVFVRRADPA